MNDNILFTSSAEKDLEEIFGWYEQKRAGLGYDFLLHIEAATNLLSYAPLINRPLYKNVRRHIIKRFPYKIFYLLDNEKVVVLAVIHAGRDPNWIRDRLNEQLN